MLLEIQSGSGGTEAFSRLGIDVVRMYLLDRAPWF